MRKTLERKEQSLLFLNRPRYAPLTLCRVCGHRFGCPVCSAWLVEHRFSRPTGLPIIAGTMSRRPKPARNAARSIIWSLAGPASNAIAEEVVTHFPTRAPSFCHPT